MIEGHSAPTRGHKQVYFCKHCRMKKQFLFLNLHGRMGCKGNIDANGRPISEKMFSNVLDDHIVNKFIARKELLDLISKYNNKMESLGMVGV